MEYPISCFYKGQKVIVKNIDGIFYISFNHLAHIVENSDKQLYVMYNKDKWKKCKLVKSPIKKLFRIVTENNKKIIVTEDHIHVTKRGEVSTKDLTTNDELKFDKNIFLTKDLNHHNNTYYTGMIIGYFLAYGSFIEKEHCLRFTVPCGGKIHPTEQGTLGIAIDMTVNSDLKEFIKSFDPNAKLEGYITSDSQTHIYNLHSHLIYEYLSEVVLGNKFKYLNIDFLLKTEFSFRKGIINGYIICLIYADDYCVFSKNTLLTNSLEILLTSLGTSTKIETIENGYKIFMYTVEDYQEDNIGGYFKITSIEPYDYSNDKFVYSLLIEEGEDPYFTLPNGIITCGCRE